MGEKIYILQPLSQTDLWFVSQVIGKRQQSIYYINVFIHRTPQLITKESVTYLVSYEPKVSNVKERFKEPQEK